MDALARDMARREFEKSIRAVLSSGVLSQGFVMKVVAPAGVIPSCPTEVRPWVRYVLILTVPADGELHVPWKYL